MKKPEENILESYPEHSQEEIPNTGDLTVFVQNLLTQMQSRFQQMSDSIITRIDDMGTRIDDLEKSIGELISESGFEENLVSNTGNNLKLSSPAKYNPPPPVLVKKDE